MQDARNAGVCVALKIYLQVERVAIDYLIADLENHAWECRRERIHKFETARRHRKAIDEAVQRFRRMTYPLDVPERSESSIRLKANSRISELYKELGKTLPVLKSANSARTIDVSQDQTGDWEQRLVSAADQLESLAAQLSDLKSGLDEVLDQKSKISSDISRSIEKMEAMV